MMNKNFKKKLAVLSSVLALNSLNVPKTQSWGVVRTFSKVVAAVFSNRLISSKIIEWTAPLGCKEEEYNKRMLRYKIASYFAFALEVALSDVVVDEVADRIGNKNVAKEPKKEKNEGNPDPANRKKVK